MDAIVSNPRAGCYTLATRNYDQDGMHTYFSMATSPDFQQRTRVRVPGTRWVAFFGKGFEAKGQLVFPAYGELEGDAFCRPLLLTTADGIHWQILAALPTYFDGKTILNEASVVSEAEGFVIFMRSDSAPYGLFFSRSPDLIRWSRPQQLCQAAHAPMALNWKGLLLLGFRRILAENCAAASLMIEPFTAPKRIDVEVYEGNIYDGGYADSGEVAGQPFFFYYCGNPEGEPYLKVASLQELLRS